MVIAGTQSGAGKTTITLGILAALIRQGRTVVSFKVGPDFIDPGHHERITGRVCRNLDGWMLTKAYNHTLFRQAARDADIVVVEGVMGLFDGYDGRSEAGSTAEMAKWLDLSVILAVNAKSMARSAAALVQGFERFDPGLNFAGVIFNNLGSRRHLAYLQDALADKVHMPCLGGIQRDKVIEIPERHLGLVTREDHPLADPFIGRLADIIEADVDLSGLVHSLPEYGPPVPSPTESAPPAKPKVRIGVARDKAFCFYYRDNLDLLASAGAELVPFSPTNDTSLPEELDGLYFGGGYPEVYARQLSENENMRKQVHHCCRNRMPIYGECGGFMYLSDGITTLDGEIHPMTGCFHLRTKMSPRLTALGYREITLRAQTPLGLPGTVIRGHEFHYSTLDTVSDSLPSVYQITDRAGVEKPAGGFCTRQTLGSYIHLHFGSCPNTARHFTGLCRDYYRKRKQHL